MKKQSKIACLILFGITSTLAAAETREEVIVIGSQIIFTDEPVYSDAHLIDKTFIGVSGALGIADVLRSSPFNTYGSFSERSGSTAQSNATLNLRGLGAERTLVLFDGRRIAPTPNLGATITNINLLPLSATDSAAILTEGASAVYGSDAIAGVVNINPRRNFEGMELQLRYGDRAEDSGREWSASLVGGVVGARNQMTFAIEAHHRDPIWDRDRSYTAARISDNNNNGIIDAYIDTDGYSEYGKSIWLYDPNTEYDRVLAANDCTSGDGFLGVVNANIDWGVPIGGEENTYCMYSYADISSNKARLSRMNSYITYTHHLTDEIDFYASGLISTAKAFGRYAPPAAPWYDMPADYADVPFDIAALLEEGAISEDYSLIGFYRWTNIGNRDNRTSDQLTDVVGGLRGSLTETLLFDVHVQSSTYSSTDFGYYYLSYPGLDYVLQNGIDPFSEEGALAMSATTTQDNQSKLTTLKAQIQAPLNNPISDRDFVMLTGVEYAKLDFRNRYDRASEGGYVGGAAGNTAYGDRTMRAWFGEFLIPIDPSAELRAAARYDHYSDFGSEISPSLTGTWKLLPSLALHTRWARGFRAPGLDELNGATAQSAAFASDHYSCSVNNIAPQECQTAQFDTYSQSNPNLGAETSSSFNLGVSWQASPYTNLALRYWQTKINNLILLPSAQELFFAEMTSDGPFNIDGNYIDRTGGRPQIYRRYTNQGELFASGVDAELRQDIPTAMGNFITGLLLTHKLQHRRSPYIGGATQNTSGFNLQPEWRAQAHLGWHLAAHRVDLIVDYIGPSAAQDSIDFDENNTPRLVASDRQLSSWTTANVAYRYDAQQWGRVQLGIRNLTNRKPVLDRTGKFDMTHFNLYDNTGRVTYLEYNYYIH